MNILEDFGTKKEVYADIEVAALLDEDVMIPIRPIIENDFKEVIKDQYNLESKERVHLDRFETLNRRAKTSVDGEVKDCIRVRIHGHYVD